MRLWHIDLIKYLPDKQLVSQWKELNSIYKNKPHHILIDYEYNYKDKGYLWIYSLKVINEMLSRNMKIKAWDKFNDYFYDCHIIPQEQEWIYRFKEHDDKYLLICFMNLYEKYIRGQKDFTKEKYVNLYKFVNTKFNLRSIKIYEED